MGDETIRRAKKIKDYCSILCLLTIKLRAFNPRLARRHSLETFPFIFRKLLWLSKEKHNSEENFFN